MPKITVEQARARLEVIEEQRRERQRLDTASYAKAAHIKKTLIEAKRSDADVADVDDWALSDDEQP